MKITFRTNRLTCAGDGDIVNDDIRKAKKSHVLACANCQSQQVDRNLENLDMYPFKNREIRVALQELFILQSQYYRKYRSL